jgi:uncharacterized membrane protein YagU involved in acid resistance
MPRNRSAECNPHLAAHVLAGLAGGLVASFAMDQFQAALARVSSGNGSDDRGQPHRELESEPSTEKAADAIAMTVVGEPIPRQYKPVAGQVMHYVFGGVIGAIYGAAAATRPNVTRYGGIPFGASLWLMADEIGVPLAGLSTAPTEYPLTTHASGLAAHLVYGATTEAVRRRLLPLFYRPAAVRRTANE